MGSRRINKESLHESMQKISSSDYDQIYKNPA